MILVFQTSPFLCEFNNCNVDHAPNDFHVAIMHDRRHTRSRKCQRVQRICSHYCFCGNCFCTIFCYCISF